MLAASTMTETLEHLQETLVSIDGYFYRVDFGPEVSPRSHRVDRDQHCICSLGESCPAVLAVIEYLAEGGEPPPESPLGYYPVALACCLVCGAEAFFDIKLSSRVRGAGQVALRKAARRIIGKIAGESWLRSLLRKPR